MMNKVNQTHPKHRFCSHPPVYTSITKSSLHCTCGKHKPVGPVAESPSLLLSASVDFEENGEAVVPFVSNEKDTFHCMFR